MITRYIPELDGHRLDDVPGIIITEVSEAAPAVATSAVDRGAQIGQRLLSRHRQYLDITIRFYLDIKSWRQDGMQARLAAWTQATEWALRAEQGAWLTINYRPGQRIRVHLLSMPEAGAVHTFDAEYAITLRAYAAYWEDATEYRATYLSARDIIATLPGTSAPTRLTFDVKNINGIAVNDFSFTAGGQKMAFSGLALGTGEHLILDYDDDGHQRIYITNAISGTKARDAYACRTPESADELLLIGDTSVAFRSVQACDVVFITRRRRL